MKKGLALGAIALACYPVMAGCGDDEEEGGGGSEPTTAAFELKQKKMDGPTSIKAGVVRVEFTNSAAEEASVQLFRLEGDHTVSEALKAGQAWGENGKRLPDWLRLTGGTPAAERGDTVAATQSLEQGNYAAVDIGSNAVAEFEVTGDGGGELPTPAGRIDAVDYDFTSSGLKVGKQEVVFENKGKEPHFVVGLPMKPGKTIDDVKKFARTQKGEAPVDDERGFSTAVLDGGVKQTVEIDFQKRGKYAFLCFIPDRAGGPPHVAKGMVAEATVE